MTKQEIADSFEQIIKQSGRPGSDLFYYDQIMSRSEELVGDHTEELVAVLRDWLNLRDRPQTPLAIGVADRLRLVDLASDLNRLRDDVAAGKCFHYLYRQVLDDLLKKLG